MQHEAAPFIEPDMTNYYRLLREKRQRDELTRRFPDMPQRLERLWQITAVKSFLQQLPPQNINLKDDVPGIVTPGRIPRGTDISNSITTRKIILMRLFEAALAGTSTAESESDLKDCAAYFGLGADQAQNAAAAVKREGGQGRIRETLRIIPGC